MMGGLLWKTHVDNVLSQQDTQVVTVIARNYDPIMTVTITKSSATIKTST